jgi:predicted dehydrogenase
MDGGMELVAGSFSSSPEKSLERGREWGLDPGRIYDSFGQMAEREAELADGIDLVSIVTPNHLHYPVARAFIEKGIHVICDKPMTNTVEEAESLCRLVADHDVVFALTHNYTGYPLVKQAREMVAAGRLGTIRKIVVEYPQGWLSEPIETTGQKQAEWRMDPARAGVSSALGDIGSHAENLARYITGLEIEEMHADLGSVVPGRLLEDDANILIRYKGGARGVLIASQISVGEENNLRIRIYGTKAALEWRQESPNRLHVRYPDAPERIFKRGNPYLAAAATHNTRIPPGHPEGYLEAFANIYLNAGRTIASRISGSVPTDLDLDFPTVQDGAAGVHFIHTAVRSGRKRSWVDARYTPPGPGHTPPGPG